MERDGLGNAAAVRLPGPIFLQLCGQLELSAVCRSSDVHLRLTVLSVHAVCRWKLVDIQRRLGFER